MKQELREYLFLGDSFNAGFAFALAEGKDLEECVSNAVGAISTTALGAQEAMPTYDVVMSFIDDKIIFRYILKCTLEVFI